jgi:S-adenosyl-L-methionine hydrolase (adenosine-forming)
MPRRRLVTLTTDLGSAYAAQMKAVLYRSVQPGHVIDIAHDLPAHGIEEASFLLRHVGAAFPKGTIHIAIVDPGVGGSRAPVAVRCKDGSFLVGPDNGVLSPLAEHLGIAAVVRLDPRRVHPGGPISATFEGRDLFAPAAARLARGAPLSSLGRRSALTPHPLPAPGRDGVWTHGTILHIDRFGNAITNVPTAWFAEPGGVVRVRLGRQIRPLPRRRTYSDLAPRALGILGSSFATLEISARESSAAVRLRLSVGQRVSLALETDRADGKYRRP